MRVDEEEGDCGGDKLDAPSAHLLQDILGFAFMTLLFGRLLFYRAGYLALLMIVLLFYDVFMVFVTPLLTKVSASWFVKIVFLCTDVEVLCVQPLVVVNCDMKPTFPLAYCVWRMGLRIRSVSGWGC